MYPYRHLGRGISMASLITAVVLSFPAFAAESGAIEEVIVTAQRTAESIQDVPIAVTALTGDMLEEKQVVTVSDLQMNAPNVSFTSTNFGSNSFSIRGIGRLLTSSTGDAGVSVHTNEIAIDPNLNSAEFYDMERVEILRGPQGTLYGKNATGGAVNFVTRKPDFDSINGFIDVEAGDYSNERIKGAVNFPLTDNFAVRIAGMNLERDGYTDNRAAGQIGLDGERLVGLRGNLSDEVDGRDQHEYRITAAWDITDQASLWVMYSKYEEDSNRARIINQVCTTNSEPTYGCVPGGTSLQQPYQTTKLGSTVMVSLGLSQVSPTGGGFFNWPRPNLDIRDMHSDFEPLYEQDNEQWFFGFDYEFENITLGIVGGLANDYYLSQQDYDMNVGVDLDSGSPLGSNFYRADGLWPISLPGGNAGYLYETGNPCNVFAGNAGAVGGICQALGFSQDYSFDQIDSKDDIYTWEVKLRSTFEGPFNFLLGYTAFDRESEVQYQINQNIFDANALNYPGFYNTSGAPGGGTFVDSTSVFGEVYFDVTDDVKITFGLRRNDDEKRTKSTVTLWSATDANFPLSTAVAGNILPPLWTRVPDFINADPDVPASELGLIAYYAPTADLETALATGPQSLERRAIADAIPLTPDINETRVLTGSPSEFDWQATTGRLGVDWQINNNSMIYAFLSRGYKPGGANPAIPQEFQSTSSFAFDEEEIDAIEIGVKNTLLDGTMVLNANLFAYDYEGLQVARIRNQSSLNENIDAEVLGAEVELFWRPQFIDNLEIDFMYSWLDSEVVDTESLDPLNRTASDPDWVAMNGILALYAAPREQLLAATPILLTAGVAAGAVIDHPAAINADGIPLITARAFLDAIGVTNIEGVLSDLDGNQLPNSPEHTVKLGIAYTWPIDAIAGSLTFRWDYYWQDETYAREFNSRGDEIDSWDQHNVAIMYNSNDGRWNARAWVRNLQDEDNVTGHYVTGDTSGNFRNYFLTEPRIYGLSVRYNFGG